MRAVLLLILASILLPLAGAEDGCAPTRAIHGVTEYAVEARFFYREERFRPDDASHGEWEQELGAVPFSGLVLGYGTWIYEETNGVPGLQRGPQEVWACAQVPATAPLVFGAEYSNLCQWGYEAVGMGESRMDENCGAGPDTLYF